MCSLSFLSQTAEPSLLIGNDAATVATLVNESKDMVELLHQEIDNNIA